MPEITVEGLSKTFGQERALNDVSFSVHDKEFLTLLGPSGCGKTTTLMSIAGFQRPDEGMISCGGRIFYDQARKVYLAAEDRNLGLVFQSYAIWPHLTVFGNVAFPLKIRRMKKDALRRRVLEALELVEMAGYAGRYPHELSGGQQQRVALARALVYSPTVLLLDEPFSNLDAKLRERARTWLKHLQTELGLTTLFVTHDQDEALSLSDRIVVMNAGSVLQAGTPEDIYHRPATRFVAEFLGHCNILAARAVTAASSGSTELVLAANGQPITVPGDDLAAGDEVQLAVRPEAVELTGHQPAAGENTYPAEVRTVSFLGDHYLYELDVGGLPLTVTSAQSFAGPAVTVRIPPSACRILPA
ncbi:MAG TPA: ABC transporter ATP-binding protein [Streptosporangiaceae bacterium]|jgi:iron(III) transport system ATP-binding protein|nr:ABC transporter ATP-binding protein [Streptosporangiaceae bacterium]